MHAGLPSASRDAGSQGLSGGAVPHFHFESITAIPMKASRFFVSTLKEAPADAEVASHRLMMRAGTASLPVSVTIRPSLLIV